MLFTLNLAATQFTKVEPMLKGVTPKMPKAHYSGSSFRDGFPNKGDDFSGLFLRHNVVR